MSRRRTLRLALIAVAALLGIALVASVGLAAVVVRRPYPQHDGTITMSGLTGTVTVHRDERGVPHVYADTPADLFRAQGFVQAQDRFFEMDWRRHVTAGRLSELTGPNAEALAADKVVRTLGWRRIAQQEVDQADEATRRHLEAFSAGVNAYLAGRTATQLGLDYSVLGLSHELPPIESWTPVDSVSWFKAMAWDLRGNYDDELDRARVYATVRDVDRIAQLYPPYPYDRHAPIISSSRTSNPSALPRTSVTPPTPRHAATRPAARPAPETGVLEALGSASAQGALDGVQRSIRAVPRQMGGGEGVGSNSWVIGGSLTATGKPLLANDPHLAPGIPGIWYQMGLHCRTVSPECPFDVSGYTFAGVPGVVIGHTNRIAWGLTNLGPDVTDFYLEKLEGDRVIVDGERRPLKVRTEKIVVAGADPVNLTIRETGHGPLLSDVLDPVRTVGRRAPVPRGSQPRGTGYGVALEWTALRPGRAMDAIFAVNTATDFESFRAAVRLLDVPAQNFVYADIDGHIGYQAPGRIPIRAVQPTAPPTDPATGPSTGPSTGPAAPPSSQPSPGPSPEPSPTPTPGAEGTDGKPRPGTPATPPPTDGTWPLPGWDSRYDWKGFVPPELLPGVQDPPEGFIVAANQPVTGEGGAVTFTRDWDYGYRSQRIRDLIAADVQAGRKLQADDMAEVQLDTRNGIAPDLVPVLLREEVDPFTAEARDLLKDWTFDQPVDSAPAAYFNAVWASLLELTFADEMPAGTRPSGGARWWETVRTLLEDPSDQWWDDGRTPNVVETRDEILRRALVDARLRLTRTLGKDVSTWQWGRLHRLTLTERPLGGVKLIAPLHPLLNRGPLEMPGGSSIVNAIGWDASTGTFDVTWVPSMRMVVDLSAFDRSRWVNLTGQSGHPGHPNYADQLDAWAAGDTFAWPFTADAVRAAADRTLTLEPRPGG